MTEDFSQDEKSMALFTIVTALARSLARSGALDRNIWLEELLAARSWLVNSEDTSVRAFDALMEMLSDI